MILPRRRRRRSSQAGFTLVELMVSLVMFSFAIAGVLAVAVAMTNGFREQRQAVNAESTARAGMEFLADALRGVSPGVQSGNIYHGTPCNLGAYAVTNSSTAPDAINAVFAYGAVATSSRTIVTTGATGMTVADASQLTAGDTLLITDFNTGHLVTIDTLSGNVITFLAANRCTATGYPVGGYPAGSMAIRVLLARFSIQNVDLVPTLMMDPNIYDAVAAQPLAEGIEDMQIAVGIDAAANGISSIESAAAGGDEWWHNVAGEVIPGTGAVRAIRISLVARSTGKLTGTAASYAPAAEDHPGASTPDQYRRRLLTSIVEIRNLGGSP